MCAQDPNNLPQPVLMACSFYFCRPCGCWESGEVGTLSGGQGGTPGAALSLGRGGSCGGPGDSWKLLGSTGLGSGRLLRSSTVGLSGSNWRPVHCEGPGSPPHTLAVGASSCPRTRCRGSQRAFPLPPKHSRPSNVTVDPEGLIPCALCWVKLKPWGRCGAFKSPTAELGRTLAITEAALCQVGK